MSDLVPRADLKIFLGIDDDDDSQDDRLDALIGEVEASFLRDCGRTERPFQDAEVGRVEVHDGNGRNVLWLQYPVTALTSIVLGRDVSDPDETLDVDDVDVVLFSAGSARLVRVDGGVFGPEWQANYVHVTYDAAADLPDDARREISAAIARVMNQRGSEGQSAERVGPYATDFAPVMAGNPDWARVTNAFRDELR
jgi:hypothetical protein